MPETPWIRAEQPLLLGSASPRRRQLLGELGIPFRVAPADVEERVHAGETPEAYLERIVADKLAAVAGRVERSAQRAAAANHDERDFAGILVADTIVVLDGAILGKPADVDEAEGLVGRLCGRVHRVFTRYALSLRAAPAAAVCRRNVESDVLLRAASKDEIRRYAESREGLDKAGAYAVQGLGSFLIERISGSYSNVVGLPVCELVLDLVRVGLLPRFP